MTDSSKRETDKTRPILVKLEIRKLDKLETTYPRLAGQC